MYALVFGCLQPSFPLAERICRLGASQNASSILVARSKHHNINDLDIDEAMKSCKTSKSEHPVGT